MTNRQPLTMDAEGAVMYLQEHAEVNLLFLGGDDEELSEELFELPVSIVCLKVRDWNGQLSPWSAPKVMKRGEDFSGGAAAFLEEIEGRVLPEAEKNLGSRPWLIAGYSLAGLFSLWAVTVSHRFTACACVSGSLWYDGFVEYMRHTACYARAAAISLGDLESRSRNPRLAGNGEATQEICRILEAQGVRTDFHWEQGNHFQDPGGRVFRGVKMALSLMKP